MTRLDLTLLAIAATAAAGILLTQYYQNLQPIPIHRRAWIQVKAKVGR